MRNFGRPPRLSRGFLFRTWLLLWAVRLGLWLLPFRKVRQMVERLAQPPAGLAGSRWPAPSQIAWAVMVTSRFVPVANCLPQAMTTQILLGRYGHPATLRIGVGHNEAGNFQAHAWVESYGAIVIGGTEDKIKQQFVALPTFKEKG